jgi:hypothetical protein
MRRVDKSIERMEKKRRLKRKEEGRETCGGESREEGEEDRREERGS